MSRATLRRVPPTAAFVEWDIRNWSVALDFWTAQSTRDPATCAALEIGSGRGGLSLWLALQGTHVVCSDLVPPDEATRAAHRANGVADRVVYEAIDATRIPYRERFDIVLFKSVLGAVGARYGTEGQRQAIVAMHRALKPGGELWFAENLVASPLHRFCRRHFVRWGATWRYVSITEMLAFLTCFREVCYRTLGFAGAFGRTPAQRAVLGDADRMLLDRLVPDQWHYIIVGVARK